MFALRLPLRRGALVVVVLGCLGPIDLCARERSASHMAALESIRADDLKRHVDFLADDRLQGREAGKPGGRAAGDYVRDRLEELGLQGAGIDGGYFQPFAPNDRNVLAWLPGSDETVRKQHVLICAHYDHVGFGNRANSRGPIGRIHNGADDNASGTSTLLELAEAFTLLPAPPRRSILFAALDAEETGLVGSKHYAKHPTLPLEQLVAVLNMDMVGRLRNDRLIVFGARTGLGWRRLVSRQNDGSQLQLAFPWTMQANADHWPFFKASIPVLTFHTGLHEEYHRPSDDAELINHPGMSRVGRVLFDVAYELADCEEPPRFRPASQRETEQTRRRIEADLQKPIDRLGVTWQGDADSGDGVRLTRVTYHSPAYKAGIRPGDRVLSFAGRAIHGGDDLCGAVSAAEGPAAVIVRRAGEPEPIELSVELAGKPLRLGVTWRTDDAEPGTVILTHVVPGSPAARAGLASGDRIYQVAGTDFTDDAQFAQLAATSPEPLEMLVERNGQIRTVAVYITLERPRKAA